MSIAAVLGHVITSGLRTRVTWVKGVISYGDGIKNKVAIKGSMAKTTKLKDLLDAPADGEDAGAEEAAHGDEVREGREENNGFPGVAVA